ncbi:unnamed protein product [Mytilus edulis]|uniref:C2H2-type domain-containing protein n=1 Tax=Mytilus edulis TaxID=6550 RepID=A0A8S3Q0J1_MYTED|nr:unnamed protein product [Mytilus edulis]
MLHSPASFQPSKKSDIVPITTMPFNDITNTSNVVRSLPQILPKPTQQKLTEPSKKPARRSLDQSFSPSFTGEVEVTISYPSGKRTELIVNEIHTKICKAIFKSENVEKAILDILVNSNPDDVVTAAAKVVKSESKNLCKRHSGSVLQNKDHQSFMTFTWDKFHKELEIRAPNVIKVVSAIVSDIPLTPSDKKHMNLLHTIASGFHGRNQEMSMLHYCIAFVLVHGGCTLRDIQRLSKIGLCVSPGSVHNKLTSWIDNLDEDILKMKEGWARGENVKYQLVGDNWDRNILPAFRTSQQKTLSLHLFNVVAVVDRIIPTQTGHAGNDVEPDLDIEKFLPSVEEQQILMDELVFIFATSIIINIPQMKKEFYKVYPKHKTHDYSAQAGMKTKQYPLGLFDTNETKTAEVIHLLRDLQTKYVPYHDEEIVEPVFFGDEKINWLNNICKDILETNFFESDNDIMKELREILTDDTHPENYYLSNIHEGDGRVKCHYCEKTYAYVGSLKAHEESVHNAKPPPIKVLILK